MMGIFIKGHAGYDEKGRDIVCAGVSALTMALYRSLMDIVGGEYDLYTMFDDGEVLIIAKNFRSERVRNRIQLFVEMFASGLKEISSLYPEYVRVRDI